MLKKPACFKSFRWLSVRYPPWELTHLPHPRYVGRWFFLFPRCVSSLNWWFFFRLLFQMFMVVEQRFFEASPLTYYPNVTPLKTNIAPEKWGLKIILPSQWHLLRWELLVSGRVISTNWSVNDLLGDRLRFLDFIERILHEAGIITGTKGLQSPLANHQPLHGAEVNTMVTHHHKLGSLRRKKNN